MAEIEGMLVNDFLIVPGQWRPQYPWEHITWISPPWPSRDFLWLDLPETVFCDAGNFYLSHINPDVPTIFPNLPKIKWEKTEKGVTCSRSLPNGVEFSVKVEKRDKMIVDLSLEIFNGTSEPLQKLRTQTCAYLRGIKEFSDYTRSNKYVCDASGQWTALDKYDYTVVYRESEFAWPVIATQSSEAQRLVAMTWYEHTGSFWCNRDHPCMHADPRFPEIASGARSMVRGALIFFEGSLNEFSEWLSREMPAAEE